MAGLYIHIPFCASRCIYCAFYSTTQPQLQDEYVDALCREMELRTEKPTIGSIYLGGGTPSQLTRANLVKLFAYIYKVYQVAPDAEITMECNPDDICADLFEGLPINRVSMGAQTFSAERLRFLHRRHTPEEVDEAVALLHRQGIHNISIDLMFGFPRQSIQEWTADVAHVIGLRPTHISAYSLMYEEGTPLYKLLEQNKVEEIDEELSLQMYDRLIDMMTEAGYEHYEISNFAKPGFRSRHNSSYWHDVPYIGLGAAAHSYNIQTRSWNVSDIKQYISQIRQGHLPSDFETIDEHTRYNDLVTTALRTREGICLGSLLPAQQQFLLDNAKNHIASGRLVHENGHLHLSRPGIMVSNTIMSDLMMVQQ